MTLSTYHPIKRISPSSNRQDVLEAANFLENNLAISGVPISPPYILEIKYDLPRSEVKLHFRSTSTRLDIPYDLPLSQELQALLKEVHAWGTDVHSARTLYKKRIPDRGLTEDFRLDTIGNGFQESRNAKEKVAGKAIAQALHDRHDLSITPEAAPMLARLIAAQMEKAKSASLLFR
jgi:hypothetical protein